jgi:hypothetical protein
MSRRLGRAVAFALVACLASSAAAEVVPATRAADYVGREVTVEGRVVAAYDSPLATVLAFAPNFAGFTATILAGDRTKFPGDVGERYRGKLVQLTGPVTAYRGKPEMQVREPSQVTVVVDPDLTPTPLATRSAPIPTPHADIEEMRRAIATLEERVGALEASLARAEQTLAAQNAPPPRPLGLAAGADAATVRAVLGAPRHVERTANGGSVWLYGTGRTVTFDTNGLVVVWTGFTGS